MSSFKYHLAALVLVIAPVLTVDGLSPACHPAMGRVPVTFEPKGLGGATGRGAEPSV